MQPLGMVCFVIRIAEHFSTTMTNVFQKKCFFLFPLNKNRYIWKNKDKKKKIIALTHAIWISSFTCMRSQKYHLLVYNTKNQKKKKEAPEYFKSPFVKLIMEDLKEKQFDSTYEVLC